MASKKPGTEGGIKSLFAQHVEKVALGIAVLLVFLFIYFGMGHQPLDEDRQPAALQRSVSRADQNIKKSTIIPEIRAKEITDPTYAPQAKETVAPVDASVYAIGPFNKALVEELEPRLDPHLKPVEKIEVRPGVIAALATVPDAARPGGLGAPPPRRGGAFGDLVGGGEGDEVTPVLREDQLDALNVGFAPDGKAVAQGAAFVVVRGRVPIVDQQEEYERCFKGKMGDVSRSAEGPSRDYPNYIYFYVERQEVDAQGNPVETGKTADGQPIYWVRLNTRAGKDRVDSWPAVEEPADPLYVDAALTMPPPPVLLQDFTEYVLHSDVPRHVVDAGPEPGPEPTPRGGEDVPRPDIPVMDIPGADIPPRGFEGGGLPAEDEGPVAPHGAAIEVAKIAEYRLFRFYDFDVHPAKQYRYRVKLLLEDPNNPREERLAPDIRTLHESVVERLSQQKAADAAKARPTRTFWRETEWSEPSDVVGFPPVRRVLAGGVVGPKTIDDPAGRFQIRTKEAVAKVMALLWDGRQALWVPGVIDELYRGSVANATKDAWVLDPVEHSLRKLPKYTFNTGYAVGDIHGGEPLPIVANRKSKLTAPGEVLMFAEDGSLQVRSEFDDAQSYWFYLYTAPEEESSTGRSSRPTRRPDRIGTPHGGGEFDEFDLEGS
jgi:hypothetical protein